MSGSDRSGILAILGFIKYWKPPRPAGHPELWRQWEAGNYSPACGRYLSAKCWILSAKSTSISRVKTSVRASGCSFPRCLTWTAIWTPEGPFAELVGAAECVHRGPVRWFGDEILLQFPQGATDVEISAAVRVVDHGPFGVFAC
jgi:hypothetical protein